jgi:predicted alpha/beta hydrolase
VKSDRIPVVASDGHRYAVEVYSVKEAPAVVQVLPAMSVAAAYYTPVVEHLVVVGLSVVTADLRGHGLSAVRARRGVDYGYHELVSVDLAATLAAVNARFPGTPVVALGHSLGGQVACLHAAASPAALAGIALIASCTVHYSGWPFPYNIGLLVRTQITRPAVAFLGYFPGKMLGFAGSEGKQQMLDWANNGLHGRYEIANSRHDFEALLQKVEVPILAMTLEGDNFAPPSALQNLLDKMPLAPLTRRHFTTDDMDESRLDHVRWARDGRPIAATIRRWVDGNLR